MGCACSSGGGTNTTTQTSQPPAAFLNAYTDLVGQAQTVAAQPLEQYAGPTVAGFTPAQATAFNTVDQSQGVANPYINAAAEDISNSTAPLINQVQGFSPASVNQYESPYTQDVVNATQAEFNNSNAQQQTQLTGNAAAQGALGGDRLGVAQGVLAGQQQLTEAPTIAGLENQGYTQALGELNTEQQLQLGAGEANSWLNSQAGYGMGNLGTEAQNTALTGASAQLQTGGLEQQLAQEELNVPYENFLQAQAYPFQTTNYLAGIAEGAGAGSGGTGTTTSPGPSALSQITGLGLTGLGAYGAANNAGLLGSSAATAAALPAATSAGTDLAGSAAVDAGEAFLGSRGGRIPDRFYRGGGVPGFDNGGSATSLDEMEELQALAGLTQASTAAAAAPAQARGGPVKGFAMGGVPEPGIFAGTGNMSTTSGGGSGGSGIGQDIMSIIPMVATAAMMFMDRGGRIHRDAGGGVSGFSAGTLPQVPGGTAPVAPGSPIPASTPGITRAPTTGVPQAPRPAPTSDPTGTGLQDTQVASAIEKLLSGGKPATQSSFRAGGHVPGFQGGGSPLATESFAGASSSGALPPGQSAYLQQLQQMPDETLMEIASRVPPNTPQGQMIQRAITMKRMNPNVQNIQAAAKVPGQMAPNALSPTTPPSTTAPTTAAPTAAQGTTTPGFGNGQGGLGGVTTQPLVRTGGRISGFAAGGTTAAPAATPMMSMAGTPMTSPGSSLPSNLPIQPTMSSFTSPSGVTVPLLQVTGLSPGSTLSLNPTSDYTAPPVSGTPVNAIAYPTLQTPTTNAPPEYGATTTLGAQSNPAPAAPASSAAPSSGGTQTVPASALSPAQTAELNSVSVPADLNDPNLDAAIQAGWYGGDGTPSQFVQTLQQQQNAAGGGWRGGRMAHGGRSGFAAGGDVDDMVMSDSGEYVPLSSLGSGPAAPRYDPSLSPAPTFGGALNAPAGLATPSRPPPQHRAPTTAASANSPAPTSSAGPPPPPPVANPTSTASSTTGSDASPAARRPQITPQAGFADSWAFPVLAAGLGIMGGRSPHAAVNIGQGALEGVKIAEEQQGRFDTRAEKQATIDQDADRLAELTDYHKNDLNLQTQRVANEAEKATDANNIAQQRATQEGQFQTGELGIRSGELGIQGQRLALDKQTRQDTIADAQARGWAPSRALTNPDGTPKLGADGQPLAQWYNPTLNQTREGPLPDQSLKARAGTGDARFNAMKTAYLGVHPGDDQGALDYASGRKQMSDFEVRRAAELAAEEEMKGMVAPPPNPQAWVQGRANDWAQWLRSPSQGQPGAAPATPGATPAPGAATAAKPGAAPNAAPAALAPMALPRDANGKIDATQLKPNALYQTGRGPSVYTGNGQFLQVAPQ